MPFDFANAKMAARRVVHGTFGVAVSYQFQSVSVPADGSITARWHNRLTLEGGLEGSDDYAQYLAGIDRLIFNREQLATLAVSLAQGGMVDFPKYNLRFRLVEREPLSSPIEEIWKVAAVGA